ncbi:MAG: hypothetical protein SXG53_14515 [Pseudomonadota bacterium]|nr:hypothetical protein [Pseudomonadota bacterium]
MTGQPLTIDVRGRRSERRLAVLAWLALAIATNLLALPPLTAVLLFMIASILVIAGLWWHGWLAGVRRLTGVSWLCDGSWLLSDAGRTFRATLSPHVRVGSRWLWLRWHVDAGSPGPRRRSMLLVRGDICDQDLRRLGVRLRLDPACRQQSPARLAGA